jgi:hypothetical protein
MAVMSVGTSETMKKGYVSAMKTEMMSVLTLEIRLVTNY